MKTKKALFPILASALLLSMGLTGCDNKQSSQQQSKEPQVSSSSQGEEEKIVITSAGNKKEIQVGESLQLTASVEGAKFSTKNDDIVTVTEAGLVTAIKDGTARITAKKDNYANGTFTITVTKAPEKEAKYSLRLEDAEHYSPNDFWGMDLSAYGMGIIGPGDSPVENNNGATDDSTSLGYLQNGCKETLKFTCDKAVKVEIGVTMAYASVVDLNQTIAVKFNDKAISMAGRETVAPETEGSYYEFHAISFGQVDLIKGTNVLEIEMIGSAPNMDKVVFFTNETLSLATIPAPVKERIVVDNADIKIEVDATEQITSKTTGLSYVVADATIASVSNTGLVKGLKAGKTTITVSKEGMKDATVSVTVRAKAVAGQIVLEAEDGTIVGGRVENNNQQASGGAHVGYLAADTSLTLKYTPAQAGTYKLVLVAASNNVTDWSTYPNVTADEQALAECMTLKVNNNAVSLESKVIPAGPWGTWVEVDLGNVSLLNTENTFLFEFSAQGPNIDCLKLIASN